MCGRPCLVVHLMSSKGIKFTIDTLNVLSVWHATRFLHSNGVDQMALLILQETYILPVLMYAVPPMSLNSKFLVINFSVFWCY